MKRASKMVRFLVIAGAVLGASDHLRAQSEHSHAGRTLVTPPVLAVPPSEAAVPMGVNHVLVGNYYSAGIFSGGTIQWSVVTPVDKAQAVECPGTSGTCTIIADHWIQVRNHNGESGSGNDTNGCLFVDGKADSNCGYSDAVLPPDGSYTQITSSHHKSSLKVGKHTVQTFIICTTLNGCDAAYFHVNYRVFKP
jgi:hypothetical protein